MVFELLERGEVLEIPAEKPLSEEEAWWECSIHLLFFKHVKLFNFQVNINCLQYKFESASGNPKSVFPLSGKAFATSSWAWSTCTTRRSFTEISSQATFSGIQQLGFLLVAQLHQACQNDYYWRWMEVAPESYSVAKNADKIFWVSLINFLKQKLNIFTKKHQITDKDI